MKGNIPGFINIKIIKNHKKKSPSRLDPMYGESSNTRTVLLLLFFTEVGRPFKHEIIFFPWLVAVTNCNNDLILN